MLECPQGQELSDFSREGVPFSGNVPYVTLPLSLKTLAKEIYDSNLLQKIEQMFNPFDQHCNKQVTSR